MPIYVWHGDRERGEWRMTREPEGWQTVRRYVARGLIAITQSRGRPDGPPSAQQFRRIEDQKRGL